VFDVTGVFAGMVILMGFVILIDAVRPVDRTALVWRPAVDKRAELGNSAPKP
jgi:NitT/TauT family transport system permease protein